MSDFLIYDIRTDEMRPVTKEDFDTYTKALEVFRTRPQHMEFPQKLTLNFRLAMYPNRMRPGESFVCEEKEIQPYEGAKGIHGEPLYPSRPDTPYSLGISLPDEFASEIVRRWNESE